MKRWHDKSAELLSDIDRRSEQELLQRYSLQEQCQVLASAVFSFAEFGELGRDFADYVQIMDAIANNGERLKELVRLNQPLDIESGWPDNDAQR